MTTYQARDPEIVEAVWHDGSHATAHEVMAAFSEFEVWNTMPEVELFMSECDDNDPFILHARRWIVKKNDGSFLFLTSTDFHAYYKKADD